MAEATLVIATRNRREQVMRAVETALSQTADLDILVMDDASTDGTAEALERLGPRVRVVRSRSSLRQMAQRNRAVAMASTDIVVMLDDDAYFTSPHTVEQTIRAFSSPNIGVVAMPYCNTRRERFVRQQPPDDQGQWIAGVFAAGSCAFRRAAFLEAGGYREDLVYQGEEGELALRLLARGHRIRLAPADPLIHWDAEPSKSASAQYYSTRNELLLTVQSVPWPDILLRVIMVAAHQLLIGLRKRRLRATTAGVRAAAHRLRTREERRVPVDRQTYRLHRRLRSRGPLPLEQVS